MKLKLPDPTPIRNILARAATLQSNLAEIATRSGEMKARIDGWIKTGDPTDGAKAQEIAGLQIQLTMLPRRAETDQAELDELDRPLVIAIETFEQGLVEAATAERVELETKWAGILAKVLPQKVGADGKTTTDAVRIAASLSIFSGFPGDIAGLGLGEFHPSAHRPDPTALPNAVNRAKHGLDYYERVASRGTFVVESFKGA